MAPLYDLRVPVFVRGGAAYIDKVEAAVEARQVER